MRLLVLLLLGAGCGLEPLKPIVPLGCRDLQAECVCNLSGDKCRWVWRCVPQRGA